MNAFKNQYTFIRNYMMSYGHRVQQTDADDIFQSAVLKALQNGDNHESPNFYGYLTYACLGLFRTLKKRRYEQLNNNMEDSKIVVTTEDMQRLNDALEGLPQSQRDAICAALMGMTASQIAVVTGTNANVASINRYRAVKTLQDRLN